MVIDTIHDNPLVCWSSMIHQVTEAEFRSTATPSGGSLTTASHRGNPLQEGAKLGFVVETLTDHCVTCRCGAWLGR